MPSKTLCPVSRDQFRKGARSLPVTLGEIAQQALPKEFSTGSLGWNLNAKITMLVGDVPCECQCGLNVTIIGSKEIAGAA